MATLKTKLHKFLHEFWEGATGFRSRMPNYMRKVAPDVKAEYAPWQKAIAPTTESDRDASGMLRTLPERSRMGINPRGMPPRSIVIAPATESDRDESGSEKIVIPPLFLDAQL